MNKDTFINETVSELMYNDEFLEYSEAMDIALKKWEELQKEM